MAKTIALALCGKSPAHIEGLSKMLLPEGYDIIHACTSVPAALIELPALLRGETPTPSSGYGSNVSNASSPTPGSAVKGIIIGGGYSADDAEQIRAACDGVKKVPFFRADVTKKRAAGAAPGPPPPEELKERVLEAIEQARNESGGADDWAAEGLYLF